MASRNFNSPEYKEWRQKVYKRDRYKCRFPGCKYKGGRKHAHHIKRYANYPTLRFVVGNGITLCPNHHKLVTGNEEAYESTFANILLGDAAIQLIFNRIDRQNAKR